MPQSWEPSYRLRWNGHLLHLSGVLGGEYIATQPGPSERYLVIYFGHMPITYIDTKYTRVIAKLPKKAWPPKGPEKS